MKKKSKKDMAASVRARLLKKARDTKGSFDQLAQRYAIERLLLRLEKSRHKDLFVLKGAMVFLTWGIDLPRPTRDLDLLGFVAPVPEGIAVIFREIVAVPVELDGLEFDTETIKAELIKEDELYAGVRLRIKAILGSMQITIQVDIGTGDSLIPEPEPANFPSLLGGESPRLRSYSPYLVVAEKLEALVKLGVANSRIKDFFDIWKLSRIMAFDGATLKEAIERTFARRGTAIPIGPPLALTSVYTMAPAKRELWKAFLEKGQLSHLSPELDRVGEEIWIFVGELLEKKPAPGMERITWQPGVGWNAKQEGEHVEKRRSD